MNENAVETRFQLGQVLLSQGVVTAEQIDAALAQQSETGHRKLLGELLVEMGYCTENQIAAALAHAYGLPYAQISSEAVRCGRNGNSAAGIHRRAYRPAACSRYMIR